MYGIVEIIWPDRDVCEAKRFAVIDTPNGELIIFTSLVEAREYLLSLKG